MIVLEVAMLVILATTSIVTIDFGITLVYVNPQTTIVLIAIGLIGIAIVSYKAIVVLIRTVK